MYTASMTPDEITREFREDWQQIMEVCDRKQAKADKMLRKWSSYPCSVHTVFRTRRKNTAVIIWTAKSRKYTGDNCLITSFEIIELNRKYAIMAAFTEEEPLFLIYTPHFFSRFSERAGIEASGTDLIIRFFEKNASYGFSMKKDVFAGKEMTNVYGSTEEGVALGVRLYTNAPIVLFRTFITYDMCKGEQIETFAEADYIRREIHEQETDIYHFDK